MTDRFRPASSNVACDFEREPRKADPKHISQLFAMANSGTLLRVPFLTLSNRRCLVVKLKRSAIPGDGGDRTESRVSPVLHMISPWPGCGVLLSALPSGGRHIPGKQREQQRITPEHSPLSHNKSAPLLCLGLLPGWSTDTMMINTFNRNQSEDCINLRSSKRVLTTSPAKTIHY